VTGERHDVLPGGHPGSSLVQILARPSGSESRARRFDMDMTMVVPSGTVDPFPQNNIVCVP